MSVWHRMNLGDAMLAAGPLDEITALFLPQYQQSDNAREMALFYRHESEGRLHCETIVYFSPAAAAAARAAGAHPCHRPSPEGLALLAGSEACWPLLFPEKASDVGRD